MPPWVVSAAVGAAITVGMTAVVCYGIYRIFVAFGETEPFECENHDGLDNKRSNMRLATRSQNQGNARLRTDNTSGRKGVTWHKGSGKWVAQIRTAIGRLHLGSFDSLDAAAAAYDAAAVKRFGEFALTNEDEDED